MQIRPYTIKFTPYRKNPGEIMMRQTKDGKGLSADGRYQFHIGEDIDEADFWVVQGKGIRRSESCRVAPGNTIFLATEPRQVLVYPRAYTSQFGMVNSCQEQMKHPRMIPGPAILPWFVGFTEDQYGR